MTLRYGIAMLTGLALAGAAVAQDGPPAGAGPRGTSGEAHDDAVGTATLLSVAPGAAPTVRIAALHPTLREGSFVEVTALDTGKTIVAMVVGLYRGRGIVGLSPDAAQALGIVDGAGVRVRAVLPSPQDQAALRSGQPAGVRMDAPPALLVALRHRLPAGASNHSARAEPPVTAHGPAPRVRYDPPTPAARQVARGGYGVQVAALSSAERAAALARALGGHVVAGRGVYRVQLGPFADSAAAARARDTAARQGYRDARTFHSE